MSEEHEDQCPFDERRDVARRSIESTTNLDVREDAVGGKDDDAKEGDAPGE